MSALAGELRKLPAFVRRDFLVAWSYRLPFVGDWIGLGLQASVWLVLLAPVIVAIVRKKAPAAPSPQLHRAFRAAPFVIVACFMVIDVAINLLAYRGRFYH